MHYQSIQRISSAPNQFNCNDTYLKKINFKLLTIPFLNKVKRCFDSRRKYR